MSSKNWNFFTVSIFPTTKLNHLYPAFIRTLDSDQPLKFRPPILRVALSWRELHLPELRLRVYYGPDIKGVNLTFIEFEFLMKNSYAKL